MFRFSAFRIAVMLSYFTLCAACGHPTPPNTNQTPQEASTTSTAGDVNFIGGGTQAPELTQEPEAYHSPSNISGPPSALAWVSDIDAAVRRADRDRNLKIILWFRNTDCTECLQIEQNIFTDPDVLAVSDNWLFVKLDTAVNPDRANYYLHGASPPAMRFLDQMGHEYRRYNGAFTKEEFITMLQTWR